jgi:CheY-like chemotaxis protein
MAVESEKALTILLAEDNPGDVGLVREALRLGGMNGQLHVVSDGIAALAFLRHTDMLTTTPRPDLVLLDLNLSLLDGCGVLTAIRADPILRTLPVIVLSGSSEPRDITTAYTLGANAYVTKPLDLDTFLTAIREIVTFWGTVATLPSS